MVVKRLIDGRFQFIRVVSTKAYTKTYLMTDHGDAAKAKCIVKHLQLPAHNTITLKFLNDLLAKRVNLLKRMGNHNAIAKNLSTVQEGQDFYWVRDYVPGQSLMADLAEGKLRSEGEVQGFLRESLGILDLIQRHGIAHQNLHPNNLIRHRDQGHLVLVDFGLIQDTGTPELGTERNGNSANHSSASAYLPQVQHRQYTRFAADHFALGMIAMQMATGLSQEAMPRLSQDDFLAQVKLQLDECSTLSAPLKELLLRMVSPQAEAQFHQAKDILVALTEVQEMQHAPSEAALSPESPPHPAEKSAMEPVHPPASARLRLRRSKLWLGTGAAVVVLALVGFGLRRLPQTASVNHLMGQAAAAQQAGQREASIDYLNQVLALKPNYSQALAQRSTLLWENGQSEQAIQDLTNAIQADPDTATWYFQRGNLRFQVGDLQGAIADYSDALQRQDTYVDAYVNRGNARAEIGDEAGAVEDYTAAINRAKDPESKADAFLNRCLSLSNLDDQAAALADCSEAVNLRPNNSFAYENRGLVKRRLNDFQGAMQDFTIAIQMNSSNPEPYYNRGLTRLNLGDLAGAMSDFDQTIRLNPQHPFAYYDRGLLHAEMGDEERAIADLETVASACLEVSRLGCFDDAQYQLNKLRTAQTDEP